MDRREFLQTLAVSAAGIGTLSKVGFGAPAGDVGSVEGHTFICEFPYKGATWKVYEDLRTRDGVLTFVSSAGGGRVLGKSAEASFPEAAVPYLGLDLKDVGLAKSDLLADKLLAGGGDPDPEMVRQAAPPLGSTPPRREGGYTPPLWDHIVGTRECADTQPVFANGATRAYKPIQYVPELKGEVVQKRFDGIVGGWMPAVRKVMPLSPTSYCEAVVFGDVEADDKFIVQTWHRTAVIENGRMTKVFYGYTYPAYPPARQDPPPEAFYRGLLVFSEYWENLLKNVIPVSLPDPSWVDISKHYFAKELVVRPGGVYPKYGAVDRDYYGAEYDGFQDIFTSAVYVNLEWGRFEEARQFIDNYYSDFVDDKGVNNMRGPETAQFGLTLQLLARYYNYTKDAALLLKHKDKIAATARVITAMHDLSLKLPADDPGYGLISGWSESDACLHPDPSVWWQPYYANSAFSARGLKDFALSWAELVRSNPTAGLEREAESWLKRGEVLKTAVVSSLEKNVWKDRQPPYVPPMPGVKLTFLEALEKERPSVQQWPHRLYAELVHADILPEKLAHMVCDTMRAYGCTTLGVCANVWRSHPDGRQILGFISYGHALELLRLDRIEEYLLFLYSHRFHAHTRGGWIAGECCDITGDNALFCIPAQQTIPFMVREMLVLEDSDEDRLYFAKGVPRAWVGSGSPIKISQAPTRWGRVDLELAMKPGTKSVVAKVELARAGSPREIWVKLRTPVSSPVKKATVNGRPAVLGGPHKDMVIVPTGSEKSFEIVGRL